MTAEFSDSSSSARSSSESSSSSSSGSGSSSEEQEEEEGTLVDTWMSSKLVYSLSCYQYQLTFMCTTYQMPCTQWTITIGFINNTLLLIYIFFISIDLEKLIMPQPFTIFWLKLIWVARPGLIIIEIKYYAASP